MPDHFETQLVERLRAAADRSANGGGEWYQLIHRCREAADEIEHLQALLAAKGCVLCDPDKRVEYIKCDRNLLFGSDDA